MNKFVVISGLMLFSLFFGAGNLIFPPMLGHTSGDFVWRAMSGFMVTGILLPCLAVIIVAYYNEGVESIGNRIHPIFGVTFAFIVYLTAGAFYGIPRASNVAYEIGVAPILPVQNTFTLIGFAVVFFAVVTFLALFPTRIMDILGKYLTPILLIIIGVLCVLAIVNAHHAPGLAQGKFASQPILNGVLEGYYTMDVLAALIFSVVVVNQFKGQGMTSARQVTLRVLQAAVIAAVLLGTVYMALAWMGAVTPSSHTIKNGTAILTLQSTQVFGMFGYYLFALIVVLACLTTCVGLITACASFTLHYIPKLGYRRLVLIFSMLGLVFTTFGLNMILSIAEPILLFIYPIAIVLVLVSLINMIFTYRLRWAYILPTMVTMLLSIIQVALTFKIEIPWFTSLYEQIPLASAQLGWLIPFLIFMILGLMIDFTLQKRRVPIA
ncbi:branched-chain amino acid transport system II carrier protein [Staphylococcus chromogenes]|uniref:branched-chain amino acid transport system II carrier protein n=1 Tax=Staphylococcus chromogenes TaxID=46126 RepID=UPI002DC000B0|nr:branched-chain amino acid transport system II carrier protein [Staphylococcus chromogenes]MEB7825631.1 branched-chain amino acid transport system II carrier protein [Staphylococcus chromogenes]